MEHAITALFYHLLIFVRSRISLLVFDLKRLVMITTVKVTELPPQIYQEGLEQRLSPNLM